MDGRHRGFSILTEAPQFKDEEAWPYHPNLGCASHGWKCAPRKVAQANALLMAAAPDLIDAAINPEMDRAHDELDKLLDDPDAGNDDIRDAAINMIWHLKEHREKREVAVAKALGEAA